MPRNRPRNSANGYVIGLRQSGQETSGTRLTPLLHVWTTWTRFWVDIEAGQEVPAEAIIGEFDERMD